jgi:hypothetical protein
MRGAYKPPFLFIKKLKQVLEEPVQKENKKNKRDK